MKKTNIKAFFGLALTVLMIGEIILTFFFYNYYEINILCNIGWIVLIISAFFGWIPIFTFILKGSVISKTLFPP